MTRIGLPALCFLATAGFPRLAFAVASGEFYTTASPGYGRFEARVRFAAGDGVVSSFFLWKDGSEIEGTFWNELDFEKVGADCHVETNAIFGNPPSNHSQSHPLDNPCETYHTYAYEWTPDAIVWLVDGVEIRRETGPTAAAFAENASGMQLRFNVWPGDASFGGNFSPDILPVHQYVDWVQYSSYDGGSFTVEWREDFDSPTLPSGWATGNWPSPKNRSTHNPANVNIVDGHLVISLTADDALGPAGAMPGNDSGAGGAPPGGDGGSAGADASGGVPAATGGAASGGAADSGGTANAGGTTSSGGSTDPAGGTTSGGSVATEGGSDPGGPSGSGGAPAAVGGSSGTGTAAGAPGAPASGGSTGTSDPGQSPPPASTSDGGGCSLLTTRPAHGGAWLGALCAAFLMVVRRRFHRSQG